MAWAGSFVINTEPATSEQKQGSSTLKRGGSFAFHSEAATAEQQQASSAVKPEPTFGQENSPESPKLWRPGMALPAQEPEPPLKPAARTKEDLYRLYETMGNSAQEMSLKALVEREKQPVPKGPLQKFMDRDAPEEGGRENNQHRHRFDLPPMKTKVIVPPRATGGQTPDRHRGTKSFGDFLLDNNHNSGEGESLHRSWSSRTPETSPRAHKRVSPRVATPQSPIKSPRAALFKPTPGNSTPSTSPRRSPGQSPLPFPHRRASSLASASSPGHLGYERPISESPSSLDWGLFGSSLRRHRVDQKASLSATSKPSAPGSPPQDSSSTDGSHKFMMQDVLKPKAAAPPIQEAQPTNLCSTCSSYTLFKTRCLVCGNIYCRNCVKDAMGSMPEGRKCMRTCVGIPLHNKYMSQAGKGCFWIPNRAKMAELRWARRPNSNPSHMSVHSSSSRTHGMHSVNPHSMHSISPHSHGSRTHAMRSSAHNQSMPSGVTISSQA